MSTDVDCPALEPILSPTYGIIVYQEQVMQIANQLAGFTLSEADSLRKAMGKKKKDVMEKYCVQFVEGCHKNHGIDKGKAKTLYELIEKFASYGFNKSHAAAYALRRVSDRVSEGELSRRIHGRKHVARTGQHRQDR